MHRLLVVDDDDSFRRMLVRILERQEYEVRAVGSSEEARAAVKEEDFALVLTDMNMPGESGLDLIRDLAAEESDLATIMVTGVDDRELAESALEMGAYGYIIKPFEPNEILIAISNALRRRELEIENRRHRDRLEQMVKDRTRDLWAAVQELEQARDDLRASQTETVERLSIAAEYRDDETAKHIHRMSRYCALLAARAGIDQEQAETVRVASIMHDVGKIGIPDYILLKPGKLTDEEYNIMKQHAEIGFHILSGSESSLLRLAADIARTHHERFDGTGYPRGLKADEIPLEGRIAAIADVFDAVTTDRIYRKAYNLGEALEIMKAGRDGQFDADLLDLFLDSIDSVLRIKEANE